jgi:MoxR-like ATPase
MSALTFDPYTLAPAQPGQPAKKRPRGRPFQRGHDPRRAHAAVGIGAGCPECNANGVTPFGIMTEKHGQYGTFLGCTNYPTCRYTEQGLKGTPAPAPVPAMTPAPVSVAASHSANGDTLSNMIAAIARDAAAQSVNEPRVVELINAAMEAQRDVISSNVAQIVAATIANIPSGPRALTVTVNGAPAVTIQGASHKMLPRVLTLASVRDDRTGRRAFNVMLVGPAGSGKTLLGEQASECLTPGQFATLSCAPGLPESALIGRMVPDLTTGTERYRSVPFVDTYRSGGTFLLDEVDNADASTLLILNSALANGHITLPSGERVERHADFLLIVSANTYGHGQSRQYVGRTQLDAAFLDRFVGATLTMDYDADLEKTLCPEREILAAVHGVRDKMRQLGTVRRIISTRAVIAARRLVTQVGDSIPAALLAVTEGWTDEDRRAVGITC